MICNWVWFLCRNKTIWRRLSILCVIPLVKQSALNHASRPIPLACSLSFSVNNPLANRVNFPSHIMWISLKITLKQTWYLLHLCPSSVLAGLFTNQSFLMLLHDQHIFLILVSSCPNKFRFLLETMNFQLEKNAIDLIIPDNLKSQYAFYCVLSAPSPHLFLFGLNCSFLKSYYSTNWATYCATFRLR